MNATDRFHAYRNMLASPRDSDEVYWWYFGTAYVRIPGFPEMVSLQAETVMVYRTETTADDEFKIQWREIGYFRDPVSGEIAERWLNPLSGESVAPPRTFQEGPGEYTVRTTDEGLRVAAVQPHASIQSIDTEWHELGERLVLVQTERKIRGFPKADGTMPDLDTDGGFDAETRLVFFGDRADHPSGATGSSTRGSYRFALDGLPAWMGFGSTTGGIVVRGIIARAGRHDRVNPVAWKRLDRLFPGFLGG